MTSGNAVGGFALEAASVGSFAEWTGLMSNRYVPLSLSRSRRDAFAGTLLSVNIEDTRISNLSAGSHRVERRAADITAADPRHLKLTLQLSGTGTVTQDGRTAVLQEGDLAVYDVSRPYTLEYADDTRTLVMVFPHQMLGLSSTLIHKLTASRLPGDSGIGRVISPFMRHIGENLDQLSGGNGIRIVRSALDLVTAMLSEELMQHHSADEPWKRTLEAVHQYIDAHLDDPDLSAATVAREQYVSLRYLQYLFHQEGQTVSGYIRARRLERCRVDLRDPALREESILTIAGRWGFPDPSHFSKVFKTVYGVSPREYRSRFHPVRAVDQSRTA